MQLQQAKSVIKLWCKGDFQVCAFSKCHQGTRLEHNYASRKVMMASSMFFESRLALSDFQTPVEV